MEFSSALPVAANDPVAGGGFASPEEELKILRQFVITLMGITDVEDLCWYAAREVVGRLGFGDCVVYLFDPRRRVLVQTAASGDKAPEAYAITNRLEIPLGQGITGSVALTHKAEVVDDAGADPRYISDLIESGSEVCVPMIHDGRLLGVIDCEDPRKGHFTQAHLDCLTAIASIVSAHIVQCELMESLHNTQSNLEFALQESERAQRSQAAFLANVSHELRTPLNAIVGFSQILSDEDFVRADAGSTADFAAKIHRAGDHLTTIVNDIIDIAALASNKLRAKREHLALRDVVEEARTLVIHKAEKYETSIEIEEAEPGLSGFFDRRHLAQILSNLMDNAVKYGARGKPVRVLIAPGGDASAVISVIDEGKGISPAMMARLFQPFTRDEQVVIDGIEGTGLGLALARELAEANGGTLTVESELDRGSTFRLTIPCA